MVYTIICIFSVCVRERWLGEGLRGRGGREMLFYISSINSFHIDPWWGPVAGGLVTTAACGEGGVGVDVWFGSFEFDWGMFVNWEPAEPV